MTEVYFGENINKKQKNKKIKVQEPTINDQIKNDEIVIIGKKFETDLKIDKNDDSPKCLVCKKTAKSLGYNDDNPLENLHTHYMGKFICEECWGKAGYPLGSGEELIHRTLLLLDIPEEQWNK